MIAALLLAVITFTAPRYDAARAGACLPDTIPVPCTDLYQFKVYGQRRGQTIPQLFQTIDGVGKEDQVVSFTPTPPDHPNDIWSIMISSVDTHGNESCLSNVTSINGTVSVPPMTRNDEVEEWFDIAGRKLPQRPTLPGVYWHRRGGSHRRVVILK